MDARRVATAEFARTNRAAFQTTSFHTAIVAKGMIFTLPLKTSSRSSRPSLRDATVTLMVIPAMNRRATLDLPLTRRHYRYFFNR